MSYDQLRQRTNQGWNTWNTRNVLSYSHLPEGFTINLCVMEYSCEHPLRESLVGRHGENEEQIFPGARTYDGSCTQLNLKFRSLEMDVRTVVAEDQQYIIVTPIRVGRGTPSLVIEACLLWGKDGSVSKCGQKIFGECGDLAWKSEELILKEWRLHGHVHENYSCYDGLGCGMHSSDKFYHWGGLLAYIALDHEENL